jgi:hypothetical protein
MLAHIVKNFPEAYLVGIVTSGICKLVTSLAPVLWDQYIRQVCKPRQPTIRTHLIHGSICLHKFTGEQPKVLQFHTENDFLPKYVDMSHGWIMGIPTNIWHDCVVDVNDTRVLAISYTAIPEKRKILHILLSNVIGDIVIEYLLPSIDLSLFSPRL